MSVYGQITVTFLFVVVIIAGMMYAGYEIGGGLAAMAVNALMGIQ